MNVTANDASDIARNDSALTQILIFSSSKKCIFSSDYNQIHQFNVNPVEYTKEL